MRLHPILHFTKSLKRDTDVHSHHTFQIHSRMKILIYCIYECQKNKIVLKFNSITYSKAEKIIRALVPKIDPSPAFHKITQA